MNQRQELISVRTLLLTADVEMIELFSRLAEAMAIHIEPCCDAELALSKLCRSKFEGVIVDLMFPGGMEVLQKLRSLKSNSSAVSFAILGHSHEQTAAFQAGANFAFERPLSIATALRVFKVSYALMVRERRRYYRHPVEITVSVSRPGKAEFKVTSLNISESGICLNTAESMQVGDKFRMRLCLPGDTHPLDVSGEVCWSQASGRVGIQFCNVKPEVAQALRGWLAQRLEENLTRQSPGKSDPPEIWKGPFNP